MSQIMHHNAGTTLGLACASGLNGITLLLPSSSRRLDNGPYHVPDLCILCTIRSHTTLGEISCLVSRFSSPDTSFSIARGFVGLPSQDLVLGSHAVSLQSPKLRLGWITSAATMSSLDAASVTLNTVHGATHLSKSF